ncbi:hypothetical protein BGX34_007309 [Mortierella sp. NVP85]|nr:hypothetical protein BGX34_007309 [Mortierella sp. NVP85]
MDQPIPEAIPIEIRLRIARFLPSKTRQSLLLLLNDTNDPGGYYRKELLRCVELFSLEFIERDIAKPVNLLTKTLAWRLDDLETVLNEGARNIRSLTTASIDTFERIGEGLTRLRHLEFKADLSHFTGVAFNSKASYARFFNGDLPLGDMENSTRFNLDDWALGMVTFCAINPTSHITGVLQRNPELRSVWLQLQPDHRPLEIIETLGTLHHLTSLCVEGSAVGSNAPSLQIQAELVLYTLQTCPGLQELVFRDLPIAQPFNFALDETITFNLTRLDLSGMRQRPRASGDYHGFNCSRVILRCPLLQHLALPRALLPIDVTALTPHLANTCPNLTHLDFEGSDLEMTGFSEFMASLTTLTHVHFNRGYVHAEYLQPWATNPTVMGTIQEVVIDYFAQDPVSAKAAIDLLPPHPFGTVVDRTHLYILHWKRSFQGG